MGVDVVGDPMIAKARRTRYIWLCHLWMSGYSIGVGVITRTWWLAFFGVVVTVMAAWWVREMNRILDRPPVGDFIAEGIARVAARMEQRS